MSCDPLIGANSEAFVEAERVDRTDEVGAGRLKFQPTARQRNVKAVRIGVAPKARALRCWNRFSAHVCRADLLKVRWAASDERGAVLRRRAKQSARYHAAMDV